MSKQMIPLSEHKEVLTKVLLPFCLDKHRSCSKCSLSSCLWALTKVEIAASPALSPFLLGPWRNLSPESWVLVQFPPRNQLPALHPISTEAKIPKTECKQCFFWNWTSKGGMCWRYILQQGIVMHKSWPHTQYCLQATLNVTDTPLNIAGELKY